MNPYVKPQPYVCFFLLRTKEGTVTTMGSPISKVPAITTTTTMDRGITIATTREEDLTVPAVRIVMDVVVIVIELFGAVMIVVEHVCAV